METMITHFSYIHVFQRRQGLDANRYATKKTIAQGMLDVALLTANASQLKYVLQLGDKHPFYVLMLTLIVTSIVLQVSRYNCVIMLGVKVIRYVVLFENYKFYSWEFIWYCFLQSMHIYPQT